MSDELLWVARHIEFQILSVVRVSSFTTAVSPENPRVWGPMNNVSGSWGKRGESLP